MMIQDSTKFIEYVYENSFDINKIMSEESYLVPIIHFAVQKASDELLGKDKSGKFSLTGLGDIYLPFISFGNTSSSALLNFHELCLFKIYSLISKNYHSALDLGANIGLHSIIMSKAGFNKVNAIEADINHFKTFDKNLSINKVNNVEIKNIAVSDKSGLVKFTRVLGNLTGSHISGSKEKVYGGVHEITVESKSITDFLIAGRKIFIKMDIESHESVAISKIPKSSWFDIDMCLEIGNMHNARIIYDYCRKNDLYLFCQKLAWKAVKTIEQVPNNWKDGSVIISSNPHFFDNF